MQGGRAGRKLTLRLTQSRKAARKQSCRWLCQPSYASSQSLKSGIGRNVAAGRFSSLAAAVGSGLSRRPSKRLNFKPFNPPGRLKFNLKCCAAMAVGIPSLKVVITMASFINTSLHSHKSSMGYPTSVQLIARKKIQPGATWLTVI